MSRRNKGSTQSITNMLNELANISDITSALAANLPDETDLISGAKEQNFAL
jgi:hypothetical protein